VTVVEHLRFPASTARRCRRLPSYSSSARARWQSGRGSAIRRTLDRFHPHVRNIGSRPDLQPILVLVQGSLEIAIVSGFLKRSWLLGMIRQRACFWPDRRPTTRRLEPGTSPVEYLHVALRGPTYRENSHANHTWHSPSRQTACFQEPVAPPVWVRFPSPAPLSSNARPRRAIRLGSRH
jgi:hypothetical protein